MDDIKIVPRVSIPKVGMQSVRMPIVGNNMDSAIMSIFKDLKSHMIGWYDVKRQGCTNESLTANPVLEDLSGNNHPLELRNFVFGGLSGMGTEKYPNSLVFNGTTPSWVYDRSNFKFASAIYGEWINNNIAHVIKGTNSTGTYFLSKQVIGQKGEILNVNIPSFKVRVKGINGIYIRFNYNECNGHSCTWSKKYVRIDEDSTIIFPAISSNINPYDEESTPFYRFDCTMGDKDSGPVSDTPVDITIEFLPNYPAPTTRMYGAIPSLTQGAKCMMMDVTPLNYDGINILYSQDSVHNTANTINYFIMKSNLSIMAYSERNRNGTYINGTKNRNFKVLDLVNIEQVISVNTDNIFDTVISVGGSYTGYSNAVMALNSLLLFNKELTEEEMKVVMDRIMKYRNVDGIDMFSAPDKIGFTVGEMTGGGDIWEID